MNRLIAGGQTGVDRAGLEVGLEFGINAPSDWVGFCPKGRRSEDGKIPEQYLMTETLEWNYQVRTEKNIQYADFTLIFKEGKIGPGTGLTITLCKRNSKPFYIVDLDKLLEPEKIREALGTHNIINIAGSRESTHPGINQKTKEALRIILSRP